VFISRLVKAVLQRVLPVNQLTKNLPAKILKPAKVLPARAKKTRANQQARKAVKKQIRSLQRKRKNQKIVKQIRKIKTARKSRPRKARKRRKLLLLSSDLKDLDTTFCGIEINDGLATLRQLHF